MCDKRTAELILSDSSYGAVAPCKPCAGHELQAFLQPWRIQSKFIQVIEAMLTLLDTNLDFFLSTLQSLHCFLKFLCSFILDSTILSTMIDENLRQVRRFFDAFLKHLHRVQSNINPKKFHKQSLLGRCPHQGGSFRWSRRTDDCTGFHGLKAFDHDLSGQLWQAENAFLKGLMVPWACEIEERIGCDRSSYAAGWLVKSGKDTKIGPCVFRVSIPRA